MTEELPYTNREEFNRKNEESKKLYDYQFWPCLHWSLNKTYKVMEIEGNFFCPECKRIRTIYTMRLKRY